jgi:hypothetical protein
MTGGAPATAVGNPAGGAIIGGMDGAGVGLVAVVGRTGPVAVGVPGKGRGAACGTGVGAAAMSGQGGCCGI